MWFADNGMFYSSTQETVTGIGDDYLAASTNVNGNNIRIEIPKQASSTVTLIIYRCIVTFIEFVENVNVAFDTLFLTYIQSIKITIFKYFKKGNEWQI